ncbi:DUF1659 domain-containing protein [Bacillus xiapuensis]|uniref:DUF1659 domain-containing protein n=1 Tax=Bacillus xiapuensis TaxID=2014075 RepID=UPI000C250F2D|nr:DUF1659 domain-containing protein [Bacillus xiapuensis]
MAQATLTKSTLRLVFDHGADASGKPILKSQTFSNINEAATADHLAAAAQALAALSDKPLNAIMRNDASEISE